MSDYGHIKNFHHWSQKVLPIVYDDSLSYYETVCKVVDYLNTVIEEVNNMGVDVNELNAIYTSIRNDVSTLNRKLSDLESELATQGADITALKSFRTLIDGRVQALENTYNTTINAINSEFREIRQENAAEFRQMRANYDAEFTNLKSIQENTLANTISAMQTKCREMVAEINGKIAELDARLTAEQREKLNNLTTGVNQAILDMNSRITTATESLTASVQEGLDLIADGMSRLNAQYATFTESTTIYLDNRLTQQDYKITENNQMIIDYVENAISNFRDMIPIFENVYAINPLNSRLENIQKIIDDLYNYTRGEALTALEWDNENKTCEEWENLIVDYIPRGMRAIEYDVYARMILNLYHAHKVFSPATGLKEDINLVLKQVNSLLKVSGSFTAENWSELGKTIGELDAIGANCYNIDWNSNTLFS